MPRNVVSDEEDEMEFDDEDREPEQGDAADDDEEEDEEGQDEYEKDDFIVDDVEEEPEEEEERADSDEERQRKKKKKKKREAEVLDDEDYELLLDNNAIQRRPPKDSKKFKRLKKAQRDTDGDGNEYSDEEFDGSGKGGRTAEEKIKRSLFGDYEGNNLEDIAEEEERIEEEEDVEVGDEDEMADFIVDEEDIDENGVPVRHRPQKRRKSKQASGASSFALQEAHEIFGDVDELLQLRRQQGLDSNERLERRLEDEFEPTVLAEKYMTEKDDVIRQTDIPERMQILEETTGPPPTNADSLDDESTWIYNQLASGAASLQHLDLDKDANTEETRLFKDQIGRFLEFHHVQKLDIPFIATYRKDECSRLLKDPRQLKSDYDNQDGNDRHPKLKWHKVLSAIQDLDRKWLLLQKRKTALRLYYRKRYDEESMRIYDETRLNLNQRLFKSIIKSLEAAESEREVDDVDAKFNLHFPPGEVGANEGQYKRPKRRSTFSTCNKAGLWEVASKFGRSAEELGLHLSLLEIGAPDLVDAKEAPEEMASNFTCAMFETPDAVLKGARHMAAVEISCEPYVRKHVRAAYMENAVVSTCPTSDGNSTIDYFHQFYGVKWLREKPVSEFKDAQWLLIQKAEEEKLLQVTFKLPEKRMNELVNECKDHYLSDGVSKSAQLWNEQRQLILQDALFGFLMPSMEKEARSLLTSRAKRWLLWEYGQVLWNKISVGPYQRKENDRSSDDEAAPRVMACCWGPGKPATTFVMLDSAGEVLDVLYTGSLTLRSQNVDDQQRKKNDQQRVLKFMMDHQPHVVALGAVNLSCTKLKEDIYEIMFKMVEENPRDVGHDMDELSIVYGDESLPRLYENSRISSDQLQSQSGIVKKAVALGRYLQNPLAMAATLCGPEREILSWKLNPLENFLTPDEKYAMVEQVMVDVTNQVGFDVNLAIGHEWLFAPLQFISGLGPRKAASLQRSLVRAGGIYTRKDFVTIHDLGKKVFVNAVGFLRVRRSGLAASSSHFIDLLDDTRIHPESYGLAQDLAKDMYELDNVDANDDDDLEMAIEHVRDHPSRLKTLTLGQYLDDKGMLNKMETFKDIRRELIFGFQDWRKPYKEPSQEEEFYMISGETEDTIAEGRIVQATVRRVPGNKAICSLESGLTGILTKDDYGDDSGDTSELAERVRDGDILTCRIKSIEMNRYQCHLVCRESEMRNNRYQPVRDLDPYYHEDTVSLQSDQEKARKEKELAKKHFKPRMIVHPQFQNITSDEAMEFLSDMEPGASIIRPSSRGPSFLTLTLKVYNGVYAHKDIVEGGKEHKDITSLLRIGKTLKIGEDTFEDLDEVIDRYVDPLVVHLKSMLNYRKFRRGTKAEVDELLKIEKAEYPMRIVYCFGISHEHPGTFILTYIRSTNPHHEYVGLYPKGFKFRKRMFEDVDRLVHYFQRHIDDNPQESGPSIRSMAAMVPMRSPAPGGGDGGWGGGGSNNDGGGWRGQSSDRDRGSGRNDYRSGGGRGRGRGGHESGVPRPYGRGRGRNNDNNDRQDSGYDRPKRWDSGPRGGNNDSNWGSFAGNRAQSSPARDGGGNSWGGGGNTGGDSSGWGGSGGGGSAAAAADDSNSGWGGGSKAGSTSGGGGWGGGSSGGGGGSSW
ncbi:Transcription elongation factor SPT6 homolog [Linum grandiflorum]